MSYRKDGFYVKNEFSPGKDYREPMKNVKVLCKVMYFYIYVHDVFGSISICVVRFYALAIIHL